MEVPQTAMASALVSGLLGQTVTVQECYHYRLYLWRIRARFNSIQQGQSRSVLRREVERLWEVQAAALGFLTEIGSTYETRGSDNERRSWF